MCLTNEQVLSAGDSPTREYALWITPKNFDQIRAVVEAASLFITSQSGHPYTGACDTDHNIGWGCNCGYYKAIAALKDLGVTNEAE